MNFRGFDTARIRALADQMKALGPGARKIHGDLAGVLFEAQELLGGKPATTSPLLQPLIGQVMPLLYTGMPAAVQQEFDSTSASMKRRCDVLDGCRQLELRGYAVDPSMLFDDEAAAPDPGKIVDALAYFNQHIDDAGGFLWSNPAQGAQEVLFCRAGSGNGPLHPAGAP